MKKIITSIAIVFTVLLLVACGNKKGFSLTIDDENSVALRESIVIKYTLNDDDDKLKSSDVKASIYQKNDLKTSIATKTLSFDKEDKTGSVTFTSLTGDTEYFVRIYAGYQGKKVTLAEKEYKTSAKGGSEETAYEIKTKDDLQKVLKNDSSGYFKLMNDIDLEGKYISVLFNSTTSFKGTFDGNGKTIKNFKIGTSDTLISQSSSQYYGFFGYISATGVVKNVTFDSFEMNVTRSSKSYYGLLAGYNAGLIENVTVTNSILNTAITSTGVGYLGGLVGYNALGGKIKNCSVNMDVKGVAKRTLFVGGVVGYNHTTDLNNEISSTSYVGNIDVTIEGTSSTTYSSETCVGGIIGQNYSKVIDCSSAGKITVVSSFKTPSKEYALRVGGLVGNSVNDASLVKDSKSSMCFDVASNDAVDLFVGLLIGQNGGDYTPSYAAIENCTYFVYVSSSINKVVTTQETNLKTGVVAVDKHYKEDFPYSGSSTFDVEYNYLVTIYGIPSAAKDVNVIVSDKTFALSMSNGVGKFYLPLATTTFTVSYKLENEEKTIIADGASKDTPYWTIADGVITPSASENK